MPQPKDPFVMFVSSVEGHLVARYGNGAHALIGARHGENGPEWMTNIVYPLTDVETIQYGREYRRAIADGALKPRTREDYDAYVKAERDAEKKTLDEIKKKAEDAEKRAAKAEDKAPVAVAAEAK